MLEKELGDDVFDTWVWKDDFDRKHRTSDNLKLIDEKFKSRLSTKFQSGKMDDVWPIENVWGILKTKLDSMNVNSSEELKRAICQKWQEIDSNCPTD